MDYQRIAELSLSGEIIDKDQPWECCLARMMSCCNCCMPHIKCVMLSSEIGFRFRY
jgi:hypothetical protein